MEIYYSEFEEREDGGKWMMVAVYYKDNQEELQMFYKPVALADKNPVDPATEIFKQIKALRGEFAKIGPFKALTREEIEEEVVKLEKAEDGTLGRKFYPTGITL